MSQFTIASFNVKNLIGPDQEYYKFQSYTPEEYAWKVDWLADQLVTLNADIIGFQEIFDEASLGDTIARADEIGAASNAASVPGQDKRYRHRAIFDRLAYRDYGDAALAVAANVHDGAPGHRRPGVAVLSRSYCGYCRGWASRCCRGLALLKNHRSFRRLTPLSTSRSKPLAAMRVAIIQSTN